MQLAELQFSSLEKVVYSHLSNEKDHMRVTRNGNRSQLPRSSQKQGSNYEFQFGLNFRSRFRRNQKCTIENDKIYEKYIFCNLQKMQIAEYIAEYMSEPNSINF